MLHLADVFNEFFEHLKFDSKLASNLYNYQIGYINRNREHLDFFGGNLLGVNVIRFKDSDVNMLFDDVFDVDYIELTASIKKVTSINHDYKVSSDVLNLTLFYVIHRLLTSSALTDNEKHRAAYDAALIFFYRCIAALISHYFKYPSDSRIAQMAYANLSNKYLIKKLGTWHKVMAYRAEDLVGKESIHYKQLLKFNDDAYTVYAINDAQGRIRDLIKNYYSEFIKVHASGDSIGSTSSVFLDAEGEETIKEKTKSVENYSTYIRSIIIDKNSFIRNDLISIISKINKNTSFKTIKNTLTWMTDEYNGVNHNEIDDFINRVIIYSFYLLNNNVTVTNTRDYPKVLTELKNMYLSTRSVDPDLLAIRTIGESIVRKSFKSNLSNSIVLSTRTSLFLYIVLRTLIGKQS